MLVFIYSIWTQGSSPSFLDRKSPWTSEVVNKTPIRCPSIIPLLTLKPVEMRRIFYEPLSFNLGDVPNVCLLSGLHDFVEYHPISLPVLKMCKRNVNSPGAE